MRNIGLNFIPNVKGYVALLTFNLAMIGIIYIFLGGAISYLLSWMFPPYDEEWKAKPSGWQTVELSIEIATITVLGFWVTYLVNSYVPFFHVPHDLEYYIESYGGQVVFLYALFIFLDGLDDKLKHVFKPRIQ